MIEINRKVREETRSVKVEFLFDRTNIQLIVNRELIERIRSYELRISSCENINFRKKQMRVEKLRHRKNAAVLLMQLVAAMHEIAAFNLLNRLPIFGKAKTVMQ